MQILPITAPPVRRKGSNINICIVLSLFYICHFFDFIKQNKYLDD